MNKVVIVGAGKTGRGFIARLAREAECDILFIDKDAELVRRLNNEKTFTVSFFGGVRSSIEIDRFTASTWDAADLTGADLIFVSVGGQNLSDAGEMLKTKLPNDVLHHIITCENASSPADKLTKIIGREDVVISEATVFCTTIEDNGLDIFSENYPYLQCDADRLRGFVPCIPSVRPVGEFGNFLTRKLYTYNAASCVIAYLGAVKGYTVYSDAANDPEILALLDKNYEATNRAMCMEFGYSPEDQAEFAGLSRKKFTSTAIKDTVERNARDVARKMAPGERIIGIMKLIGRHAGDTSVMEMTTAAALLYSADPKWNDKKESQCFEDILYNFCGIKDADQIERILNYAEHLRQGNLAI